MTNSVNVLSLKIESELEKSIRNRVYDVGHKLPTENELCRAFSVSRTAIREALNSLKARGLITIKKGSGAYVAELTTHNAIAPINLYLEMSDDKDLVKNTIYTRQAFEPEIAALAAKNKTNEDLLAIEKNLDQLVDCTLNDIKNETEIDGNFHSLVAVAANNPVISLIMGPIHNLIPKHKNLIYGKNSLADRREIRNSVILFHSRIYEAIKNGDTKEAYYQMKEHLRVTEKNNEKYLP